MTGSQRTDELNQRHAEITNIKQWMQAMGCEYLGYDGDSELLWRHKQTNEFYSEPAMLPIHPDIQMPEREALRLAQVSTTRTPNPTIQQIQENARLARIAQSQPQDMETDNNPVGAGEKQPENQPEITPQAPQAQPQPQQAPQDLDPTQQNQQPQQQTRKEEEQTTHHEQPQQPQPAQQQEENVPEGIEDLSAIEPMNLDQQLAGVQTPQLLVEPSHSQQPGTTITSQLLQDTDTAKPETTELPSFPHEPPSHKEIAALTGPKAEKSEPEPFAKPKNIKKENNNIPNKANTMIKRNEVMQKRARSQGRKSKRRGNASRQR